MLALIYFRSQKIKLKNMSLSSRRSYRPKYQTEIEFYDRRALCVSSNKLEKEVCFSCYGFPHLIFNSFLANNFLPLYLNGT